MFNSDDMLNFVNNELKEREHMSTTTKPRLSPAFEAHVGELVDAIVALAEAAIGAQSAATYTAHLAATDLDGDS